jgi:aminoglycoside phosphotransferase (APT) family kinase protein
LEGRVPGDNPPYMLESFVVDMTPEQRNAWHRNGVEVMSRVGAVDWRAAGFRHLDKAHHGALGPEQRQGYFRHYLDWATKGEHHPIAHPAFAKLLATWPDDGDVIELCWGDARPGNQMSRGTEVIAVFDWEMVSLGNSESDLGWWSFLQRYSSVGCGAPLLDGLLDRDETVAEWERHRGRRAEHFDFYEQLAGFHFTLVMIKLAEMMSMPEIAVHNPVSAIAAELLELTI